VRREDDPNDAVPGDRPPDFQYKRESGIGGGTILLGIVAVLLLIFFLQNRDDANIDFLFWEWDVAIAVAIGLAAILGFVLGWGFAWMRRRARRLARRDDRRD
jgi:uncharacterized integral membrane protein